MTNMPQESLQNTGPTSNDIPISETLFDLNPLTLSAEASHARTFPLPANEKDLRENDQLFGQKCFDSFAKLSPDGLWLKTSQGFSQVMVDGSSETYSETWPRQGMMRNGECYLRPEWEHHTLDGECLSWPTPRATEWKDARPSHKSRAKGKKYEGLSGKVKMWPTPNSWDGKRGPMKKETAETAGHQISLNTAVGSGQLNPTWVEWLMGFHLGWTDLSASETPSSLKSRKRLGK